MASRPLFTSSLELARASGDRWAEADSLQFLGFSHLMQHRPAPAGALLAQSGALADEMGNAFQQAWQHIAFGSAQADVGELADAVSQLRTGIGIARRVGDPAVEIWGCSCWALVELSAWQRSRAAGDRRRHGPPRPRRWGRRVRPCSARSG